MKLATTTWDFSKYLNIYDSIKEIYNAGFRYLDLELTGKETYFADADTWKDDIKRIVPYAIQSNDQINSEYVFLLSQDEVEKYIPQKEDRIATAVNHIFDVKKPWHLRFNDEERYYFIVDTEGNIVVADRYYDKFRPAVWVK